MYCPPLQDTSRSCSARPRHGERKNARRHSILAQRDMSQERTSGQSRPGIMRAHGFAVISKDDDFRSLSLVNGAPPKVIWLRIGNASTAGIEAFIRSALVKIRTFEISPEE